MIHLLQGHTLPMGRISGYNMVQDQWKDTFLRTPLQLEA